MFLNGDSSNKNAEVEANSNWWIELEVETAPEDVWVQVAMAYPILERLFTFSMLFTLPNFCVGDFLNVVWWMLVSDACLLLVIMWHFAKLHECVCVYLIVFVYNYIN